MKETIKIMAPAKINLTLKVQARRADGFHPIESIMQSVSLCDYLTLKKTGMEGISITTNSFEIPCDESNIAYKAAKVFLDITKIKTGINIYIEKNIPVCAGLAGGSTDAAAVLYGLNKIFGMPCDKKMLHQMCANLGSDLNFCLEGGLKMTRGRGEILEDMNYKEFCLTIVKPKKLKISAKEAYDKFDMTDKVSGMPNDLEHALIPYYKELQHLSSLGFQMSGSGPSFFVKKNKLDFQPSGEYEIYENLKTLPHGVIEINI